VNAGFHGAGATDLAVGARQARLQVMSPMPPEGVPDPEHFPAMNASFYAARPQDYFGRRLQNLMLVAGNLQGLDDLFAKGVSFGTLSAVGPQVSDGVGADTAQERARQTQHFLIAESEVLCHHAGETLLRLYLAHAGAPPSPWLELSQTRSPDEFKKRVRRRFGPGSKASDPANLAEVARTFYLTDVPERLVPPPAPEEWSRGLALIEGYLRYFAALFLEKAALYNAAKHGLALLPGDIALEVGDGSVLSQSGPAVQYLQLRKSDDGHRRWSRVIHWVQSDRQVVLTYTAAILMADLWAAGRFRYVVSVREDGFSIAPGPEVATSTTAHTSYSSRLLFPSSRAASALEMSLSIVASGRREARPTVIPTPTASWSA